MIHHVAAVSTAASNTNLSEIKWRCLHLAILHANLNDASNNFNEIVIFTRTCYCLLHSFTFFIESLWRFSKTFLIFSLKTRLLIYSSCCPQSSTYCGLFSQHQHLLTQKRHFAVFSAFRIFICHFSSWTTFNIFSAGLRAGRWGF
jgi:hypothetical protein